MITYKDIIKCFMRVTPEIQKRIKEWEKEPSIILKYFSEAKNDNCHYM